MEVYMRRSLDGAESMAHKLEKYGISNVTMWATLISEIPLQKETLHQSFVMVARRQPMLRTTIVDSSDGNEKHFEFVEGPVKVDLKFIDRCGDDCVEVAQELFESIEFNVEAPAWKAFLLREEYDDSKRLYRNVIGFIAAHALIDGRSLTILLQEVVANMNAIANGTAPGLKDILSFPLLPSNATLLAHRVGWSKWQQLLLFPQMYSALLRVAFYAQSFTKSANPVLAGFPTINREKARDIKSVTKMLSRIISVDETSKLVKWCKSEGSSVSSAISAACHIAFCRLLDDKPYPNNATNDMSIAISARPYHCPQLPSEYIGNYVASVTHDIPLARESSDFWQIARQFKETTTAAVEQGKHLTFVSVLEAAGNALYNYILQQGDLELHQRRSSGNCVSNVGVYVHEKKDGDVYCIDNEWFASASHKMFATCTNYIITVNGKLNWITCYDASIVSTTTAQRYSEMAWQILKQSFEG